MTAALLAILGAIIAAVAGAWTSHILSRRRVRDAEDELRLTELQPLRLEANARDDHWRDFHDAIAPYAIGRKVITLDIDSQGGGTSETAYHDVTPSRGPIAAIQISWRVRLDHADAAVTSIDTSSRSPWAPMEVLAPPTIHGSSFVSTLVIPGPFRPGQHKQFKYTYTFSRAYARFREELSEFGYQPGDLLPKGAYKGVGFAAPTMHFEMWIRFPTAWWGNGRTWEHVDPFPVAYPFWEPHLPLTSEMDVLERDAFKVLLPDRDDVDRPAVCLLVTPRDEYIHPLTMYGVAWTPPPSRLLPPDITKAL